MTLGRDIAQVLKFAGGGAAERQNAVLREQQIWQNNEAQQTATARRTIETMHGLGMLNPDGTLNEEKLVDFQTTAPDIVLALGNQLPMMQDYVGPDGNRARHEGLVGFQEGVTSDNRPAGTYVPMVKVNGKVVPMTRRRTGDPDDEVVQLTAEDINLRLRNAMPFLRARAGHSFLVQQGMNAINEEMAARDNLKLTVGAAVSQIPDAQAATELSEAVVLSDEATDKVAEDLGLVPAKVQEDSLMPPQGRPGTPLAYGRAATDEQIAAHEGAGGPQDTGVANAPPIRPTGDASGLGAGGGGGGGWGAEPPSSSVPTGEEQKPNAFALGAKIISDATIPPLLNWMGFKEHQPEQDERPLAYKWLGIKQAPEGHEKTASRGDGPFKLPQAMANDLEAMSAAELPQEARDFVAAENTNFQPEAVRQGLEESGPPPQEAAEPIREALAAADVNSVTEINKLPITEAYAVAAYIAGWSEGTVDQKMAVYGKLTNYIQTGSMADTPVDQTNAAIRQGGLALDAERIALARQKYSLDLAKALQDVADDQKESVGKKLNSLTDAINNAKEAWFGDFESPTSLLTSDGKKYRKPTLAMQRHLGEIANAMDVVRRDSSITGQTKESIIAEGYRQMEHIVMASIQHQGQSWFEPGNLFRDIFFGANPTPEPLSQFVVTDWRGGQPSEFGIVNINGNRVDGAQSATKVLQRVPARFRPVLTGIAVHNSLRYAGKEISEKNVRDYLGLQ